MAIRFRPYGLLGSMLEVLAGLLVLRSALWTNEDYSGGFTTAIVVVGAVLIGAGVIGLVIAARRALRTRSTRTAA